MIIEIEIVVIETVDISFQEFVTRRLKMNEVTYAFENIETKAFASCKQMMSVNYPNNGVITDIIDESTNQPLTDLI